MASRVTGLAEVDLALARHRAELVFERELQRRSGAVEQSNFVMRDTQRVAHHRAQRRDSGPAGDEQESAFGGIRREREPPQWAVDVDRLAGPQGEMQPGGAFRIDANQQLQVAVPLDILRRGRD